MLSRLWLLITIAWMGFCLYGFHDSGEIHHMTPELWAMPLKPVLIRLAFLFVVVGVPRGPHRTNVHFAPYE